MMRALKREDRSAALLGDQHRASGSSCKISVMCAADAHFLVVYAPTIPLSAVVAANHAVVAANENVK